MCGSPKDGEGVLLNGTKCLQATSMDRIFCWAEKNFRALSSVMSVTWKRLYCKISSWLKKGDTIFLLWIVERGGVAKYGEGKKHALFLLQRATGFINVVEDSHGDERPEHCATRPELQAAECTSWSFCGFMLSAGWLRRRRLTVHVIPNWLRDKSRSPLPHRQRESLASPGICLPQPPICETRVRLPFLSVLYF